MATQEKKDPKGTAKAEDNSTLTPEQAQKKIEELNQQIAGLNSEMASLKQKQTDTPSKTEVKETVREVQHEQAEETAKSIKSAFGRGFKTVFPTTRKDFAKFGLGFVGGFGTGSLTPMGPWVAGKFGRSA